MQRRSAASDACYATIYPYNVQYSAAKSSPFQCTQALLDAMVTYQALCTAPDSFFGFDPRGNGWSDPQSYQTYCQSNGVSLTLNGFTAPVATDASSTSAAAASTATITTTTTTTTTTTGVASSQTTSTTSGSSSSNSSSDSSSGSSTPSIVGGIVAVVVIAAIGYCFWQRNKKRQAAAASENYGSAGVKQDYVSNQHPDLPKYESSIPIASTRPSYVQYTAQGAASSGSNTIQSYDAVDAVQF